MHGFEPHNPSLTEIPRSTWDRAIANHLESPLVQRVIVGLIIINGITLGIETSPSMSDTYGTWLSIIDTAILTVFVFEIGARIAVYRCAFFRDPWSVFDFAVIAIALVPASGPWSVLRAFRILRMLRLVTAIPALRQVAAALISAIPGLGAIVGLMLLILYVAAVIATELYGDAFPALFGSLGQSLFSLFQVMTLEGWSAEIVRPVMTQFPHAWLFFIPFILLATFTMLNLFIGVVVAALQSSSEHSPVAPEAASLAEELRACQQQLKELTNRLTLLRPQTEVDLKHTKEPPCAT
jgi:voltage-gated sodium channel